MTSTAVETYLKAGFYVQHSTIKRLLVEGPDAFDFLNRLSTVNFSSEVLNQSLAGAFLNEKSEIISLVQFWCKSETAVELFATDISATFEYLNKMLFSENLKLTLVDNFFWIEERSPLSSIKKVQFENEIAIPLDNWGLPGILRGGAAIPKSQFQMADHAFLELAKAGFKFSENVKGQKILDVNLERYLNREKGCYPGQEVVEKTITYGKPSKNLILFSFASNTTALQLEMLAKSSDRALLVEDRTVGQFISLHHLDDFSFGLGLVNRLQSEEDTVLKMKESNQTLRIESHIDRIFGR